MGLFYTDVGAKERGRTGASPRQSRVLKISAEERRNLSCTQCPLDKEPLNSPKMVPTGPAQAPLYILGEAPGKTEDEEGRQFVGSSGRLIRDLVPARWANKIRWNNTVRCRPPGNRDPEPIEIACCRNLQEIDIERCRPRAIIGFGGVPTSWALGPDRPITAWRGRRVPVKIRSHTCWFYPITHPAALLRNMNDRKKGQAYERCFERDIARVFSDLEGDLPIPLVEEQDHFFAGTELLTEYGAAGLARVEQVLDEMAQIDHSIDIETIGLRPYSKEPTILSVAVGTFDKSFAFGWMHREARWSPQEKRRLREMVGHYLLGNGRKWAHKAAFEQEWLHAFFGPQVIYDTPWGDTYGQAHIIDERPGKGLDDLTQIHFGFRIKDLSPVDVRNLANHRLHDEVLPYNVLDAKYCHMLSLVQTARLEELGLTDVYEERNKATPAFVRMQARGVVRNMPAILTLDKDLTLQEEKARTAIMGNKDVVAYCSTGKKFNPTSPQTVIALFRDYLRLRPGGRRANAKTFSSDEETLSQIRHPVAGMILNLRSIMKNHGYVTPLLDGGKYVHDDGLVHASYSQYSTVSGRSSCEDPNQQNYPRREHKEIRTVVGCPPGHLFVAFDYGQLEARIVAAIANDRTLIGEIRAGQDIHGSWTDAIGGHFIPDKVLEDRKKVRDSIKQSWTFANFYGNVLEAVAFDLSRAFGMTIPPDELAPFFDEFWSRYAGVKAWQEQLMDQYWTEGYVATATGQRRHEPMGRNEIINHPIQGTAGHLVIDAQARISELAYREQLPDLQPIMNIHDDLSFYLPEDGVEDYIEIIARHMCRCPFDFLSVPLTVEVSIGTNWANKEEVAVFSSTDFQDD